jgi:hypothetical protein
LHHLHLASLLITLPASLNSPSSCPTTYPPPPPPPAHTHIHHPCVAHGLVASTSITGSCPPPLPTALPPPPSVNGNLAIVPCHRRPLMVAPYYHEMAQTTTQPGQTSRERVGASESEPRGASNRGQTCQIGTTHQPSKLGPRYNGLIINSICLSISRGVVVALDGQTKITP